MLNQTKIEKFYQKLQQKFSRRIDLDRSRIFLALNKFGIDQDMDLSGEIIQCIGSDGKNCVVQFLKSVLIENKKKVTTFGEACYSQHTRSGNIKWLFYFK